MAAYYNEFEPFAAKWLRELIRRGLLPAGEVDTRSITEVSHDDLKEYTQCHFFAGIGGWSYALRLAGWDDDRPVWTGSCPCQPFSAAGKQQGTADARHLWPVWFRLIAQCRPPIVFGEQVSSAIAHGWLDGVADDLEDTGYAFGSAVLPACSVGAPHKRDRLWFVADATGGEMGGAGQPWERGDVEHAEGERWGKGWAEHVLRSGRATAPLPSVLGDADQPGPQGQRLLPERTDERSPWAAGVGWQACGDGKARLVKSGIRLLAHGVPARVGRLRGYGNAIVPQVAAEFIRAYMGYDARIEEMLS